MGGWVEMVWRAAFNKGVSFLLNLLYPPHCVACGKLGAWFCMGCVETTPAPEPPLCRHCGKPRVRAGLCEDCRQSRSYLAGMRSVALHLPPIRQAVHALKYEGLKVLAQPLGAMMAEYWQRAPLPANVIIPVPLHRARIRQRGYNQSLLLARVLGEQIGLELRADLLTRERDTRSQVGLKVAERRDNVSGAFRCRADDLQGQRVLLVDDVLTTGATLESCAGALLGAGAAEVWALTLTRAVGADAGDRV